MKKRYISIFSFVVFSIFISSEVLAIEPCHNFYVRGDSDGDNKLTLTDAVYTLNYLFIGEVEPFCLEEADINGDTKIDITDAIYTLNYLFRDGPEPVTYVSGVQKVEFYGEGTDDAPELAFLGIDGNIEINELPTVFEVIELTHENGREISEGIFGGGDIASCKVDVYENGGVLSTTFEANWENGIDISSEPLKFEIGDGDGVIVEDIPHYYTLEVSCIDLAGQEGKTSLSVETIKKETPSEPNCRKDIDVCCKSTDVDIVPEKLVDITGAPLFDAEHSTVKGDQYVCVRDCSIKVKMNPDGSMEKVCGVEQYPKCNNIGLRDILAGFDTRNEFTIGNVIYKLEAGGLQVPRQWKDAESIDLCNANGNNIHPPLNPITPFCAQESVSESELTKADKNEEKKIQYLSDEPAPSDQPKPSGSPCYVNSMTIISDPNYYKNNVNGIKDDFEIWKWFIPEKDQTDRKLPLASDANNNNNVALGPIEGWLGIRTDQMKDLRGSNAYATNYGLLVSAVLEKGSKHENCFKGQFQKITTKASSVIKNRLIFLEMSRIMAKTITLGERGTYMEDTNSIRTKSYKDLKTLASPGAVKESTIENYIVTHLFENGKWQEYRPNPGMQEIMDKIKKTHCFNSGTEECSDDYSERLDLLKYVPQYYRTPMVGYGQGACYIVPPKIIWWDMPGYISKIDSSNIDQFAKGPLPLPGVFEIDVSLISIVEDSGPRTADIKDPNGNIIYYAKGYQYRWLCEQDNLIIKRNDNVDLKSGDPAKMRRAITTPPSCTCVKQKRLPGGLYEDDTANGGIINC